MKKAILPLGVLLIGLTLNSCGVMFGGSRYNANIKVKDHPNADIYINGEKKGTGELTSLLKRNRPLNVQVKQEGCEPKVKNFDNTFRTGNFILSALTWGILGVGIDLGTGAAYKPDHKHDPSIKKLSDKDYEFIVDYSECKQP